MLAKIKERLRKLPHSPGIYIFKDAKNRPLYIGKSSDLKNRAKYYLKTDDFRLQKMVATAKKVDYIQTCSDIEALILESQYIKKYRPMFNIMLRDDKQYFYVGFTEGEFPKIFLTHQSIQKRPRDKQQETSKNKKSAWSPGRLSLVPSHIGPFTDGSALKTTLNYLRRIFPYCTCKQPHNNYCLNYHIGKCIGICCLKNPVSSIRYQVLGGYRKNVRAIKDILSGKKRSLVRGLEKEMKKLAKEDKLEEAIEFRSKLEKLERVFENAKIISNARVLPSTNNFLWKTICREAVSSLKLPCPPSRIEGYDVANIQGKYAVGAMVVFTDGKPNKSEYRKFKIHTKESPDDAAMLREVLTRRFNHPEWEFPNLILVDGGKAQLNATHSVIYNLQFTIYKQILNSQLQTPTIIVLTKNKKHRGSKIYVSGKKNPVPLSKLPTDIKNLLLRVDSEAHRFAITYYRKIHRRKLTPRFTP